MWDKKYEEKATEHGRAGYMREEISSTIGKKGQNSLHEISCRPMDIKYGAYGFVWLYRV